MFCRPMFVSLSTCYEGILETYKLCALDDSLLVLKKYGSSIVFMDGTHNVCDKSVEHLISLCVHVHGRSIPVAYLMCDK